jgi:hypothetical protein
VKQEKWWRQRKKVEEGRGKKKWKEEEKERTGKKISENARCYWILKL